MPDLKATVSLTSSTVEKMSRHDMLEWVNSTVHGQYKKIEELCSGKFSTHPFLDNDKFYTYPFYQFYFLNRSGILPNDGTFISQCSRIKEN